MREVDFTQQDAQRLRKPRPKDGHKGCFGHALLRVGSEGMLGAALLSTRACLRSGVGLVSTEACDAQSELLLHIGVPEALVPRRLSPYERYQAIGCGCGLGKTTQALQRLRETLQSGCRLLLDADALNLLAAHNLHTLLPAGSLLTPHAGEMQRLCHAALPDRAAQVAAASSYAQTHQVYVVMKGANTAVCAPDGRISLNTTGNAGMATGGSGDVLAGLLTGLLAQVYSPWDAARLGVWLHGKSGDLAVCEGAQESLTAGDLTRYLGKAFRCLGEED